MAARVVRKAWDVVMYGYDNHGGLYYYNIYTGLGSLPGPPVPYPPGLWPTVPFSFHVVLTSSAWPMGEHKINPTVLVEGDPIVSKGHEAKHDYHVPPGINLLVPVTIIFASSKWVLGVGSVQATMGPVASTVLGPFGANYNCQDPCAFPIPNIMVATASVQVEASAADWGAAGLEMFIQSAMELAISAGLEHGPGMLTGLTSKLKQQAIVKRVLGGLRMGIIEGGASVLEKVGAKPALRKAAKIAKDFVKGGSGDVVKDQANKEREKRLRDSDGREK